MPTVSRLSANGKFMIGNLEIDEITTSNNTIRISESKMAVEIFDEVSMNPRLASNILTETQSRETPTVSQSGALITLESIVGPFGTTELLPKIASSSSFNGWHYAIYLGGSSIDYESTFSVFAKAAEARYFSLTCDDGSAQGFYAVFDALSGQVVSRNINAGTNIGATSTYHGNGWWRFSVSGRLVTQTNNFARFSVNLVANYTDTDWYAQSIVPSGNGLYIAYWQIEPNTFASTLKLGSQTPFANPAMRLETANTTNTTFIVDRSTTLLVGSEFDEVNTII